MLYFYDRFADFSVLHSYMEAPGLRFSFWKVFSSATPEQIKQILMRIRDNSLHNFLLLTGPPLTKVIFYQARRLGLVSPSYSWMVLNLVSFMVHLCSYTLNFRLTSLYSN